MSWQVKPLGELADTQLGKMLNSSKQTGLHSRPYLRNVNVQWGWFDMSDVKSMDIFPDEESKFLAQKGDLLICEGGEVGRCAVWNQDEPVGIQNAVHRVRAGSDLDTIYLRHYLQHLALAGGLERFSSGVTIKHLTQEKLRRIPIAYPPLDEQKRIVAQLEDQLGKLEAVRAEVAASKHLLQDLRASSISQVFESVGADAETRIVELGNVAEVLGGTTPKGISSHLSPEISDQSRIPFFKVGDMNSHPSIMTEARNYISDIAVRTLGMRLVPAGSIVFPKAGGAIATNKKRSLGVEGVLDLNCMAVVPGPELNSEYLHIWFQNKNLTSFSNGSVLPQIGRKTVAAAPIPVPRIDIQIAIVRRISKIEAVLAVVEEDLVGALARADSARSSILHRAFLPPGEGV